MTRDLNQHHHPADPGQRAGTPEAERQTKMSQLPWRRFKLSTEEAALLRELFHDILAAHHEQVWNRVRRRVPSHDDAEELYQDVFLALHTPILEHGSPDSLPGMLNGRRRRPCFDAVDPKFAPLDRHPGSSEHKR